MAIEARHLNPFPQQLITNRDLMNTNYEGKMYGYINGQIYGANYNTTLLADNLLPLRQTLICDSVQGKTSMKTESGLTYNLPVAASRKRTRDSMNTNVNVNQLNTVVATQSSNTNNNLHDLSSVFGEESFSLQLHQQQLEMDLIIDQHTKKIRLEVEEKQKQQSRLLVSAIGEGVIKKLREKDEQIQKIAKINLALQERVKSLYIENQLWRDLAQSNEATAMSLRYDLEKVLAHVSNEQFTPPQVAGEAESYCGSNDLKDEDLKDEENQVVVQRQCKLRESGDENRLCRKCGERESCVLLLPCRHLCLCTSCGTTLQNTCPVCNCSMNATVHVYLS